MTDSSGFESPFATPNSKKKKKAAKIPTSPSSSSPSPGGGGGMKSPLGGGSSGNKTPSSRKKRTAKMMIPPDNTSSSTTTTTNEREREREFVVRDEHERMVVYVYERNKPKKGETEGAPIANVAGKIQGVWQDNINAEVSPCQLWAYPSVPKDVLQLRDIYGVWGYKPGVNEILPTTTTDPTTTNPDDMWFFSPKTKPPSYFTPRGIWTYPLVKRDVSQIAPHQSGFVNVGERAKIEKLDVGGTWKLLYKAGGGDEDEDDKGPGIKPRALKTEPPPPPPPKIMEIHVETPDGKTRLTLEVTPKDTIDSIQERVKQQEGTPKKEQRLQFRGVDLDQPLQRTLQDYNIQDGDTLKMAPMEIHVHHYNGMKFTMHVVPTQTLSDTKDQIERLKKKKIPRMELQRISFQGKPLTNDSKTLRDYKIQHKSILVLEPMTILVKTPEGNTIPFQVEPTDTTLQVKKQIEKKLGIPPKKQDLTFRGKPMADSKTLDESGVKDKDVLDLASPQMHIHIKHWDGSLLLTLEVEPTDTIDQIQQQILKQKKIPIHQQRLTYRTKPLEDPRKTLEQYNIQNQDTLDLIMEISVKTPEGKLIPLIVKPTDKIKDIKKMVANKENIPVDDQRLQFNGKPLDNDDDDDDRKTLDDVGIKHGDTVIMEGMQINVKDWNRNTATYNVTPSDTLESVKVQVAKRQGIPVEQQRVSFNNRPLKEDHKTLKNYGIKHLDTLELLPMHITVKTPEGKPISLIVKPTDTVKDIKKKVADKENIPIEDQRLQFNGKPLDDDRKTLEEVGINHGDTVNMEGMQILVKDLDGKTPTATYDVTPTDTLQSVKLQVAKRQGIPVEQQRVRFNNRPLKEDNKTLKQYGIKHMDTLELLPMEITVKTPEGKSVPLIVKPSDTVKDIKKKVADKENIPIEDQRLQYDGKPLDDDRQTLDDLGVKHGDTIPMEGMTILVEDWDGNTKTYDVTPNDTLEIVKRRVSKKQGIPVQQQRPTFQNKPLKDDGKNLKQYGIRHDDTLVLAPMEITVKTPEGKSVPLIVKPSDTVKDIKKKVADKENIPIEDQRLQYDGKPLDDDRQTLDDLGVKHGDTIPMEGMKILVEDWDGNTKTYDVTPNDTLEIVKRQVSKKQGIPVQQQRPTFQNKPLKDDGKTLKQYGIRHDDTLVLAPMEITVKTPEGKSVPLIVKPSDTVKDIKKKVADKENIPIEDQRLQYDGKPLDDDRQTLDDLGVKHGDTIPMEGMKILVEDWDGNTKTYDVTPNDTLEIVKRQVSKKQGIPVQQQRPTFQNKPLKDDGKTLKQYGIRHDDTLVLAPMEITVKTPDRKSVPLIVKPSDTVKDIKKKVADKENIPIEDQRLQYDGKPLDDDRQTLDDLGVKHGDTIPMEGMTILVEDWDGNTKTYDVTPNDTLEGVKRQVSKKQGIPVQQQRPTFQNKLLKDDGKTLKQYGIRHQDTLVLGPMEITVKTPDRKSVPLIVKPSDTVKDIKKKVADKENIPIEDQRLQYDGKPLDDDRQTLDDLGVKHGDTMSLEPMRIHVRDAKNNKKFTLDVEPSDTIDSIKLTLENIHGLSRDEQRLRHGSTPLDEDTRTLRDYGIKHDDTLDVGPFLIYAKLPNGQKITLDVDPWNTTKDIKSKIEDSHGWPAVDQTIKFNDKLLEDNKTLTDSGIKHGDTVVVKAPPGSPRKTASNPKKKSYLPENWKEERERFGEIITTYYEIDHNVDEGENFIRGISAEEREKFKMTTPKRKSDKT